MEIRKDENTTNKNQNQKLISNKRIESDLFVDRESFIIKAPAELHDCRKSRNISDTLTNSVKNEYFIISGKNFHDSNIP